MIKGVTPFIIFLWALTILIPLVLIAFIFLSSFVIDYYASYHSWRNISSTKIADATQWYIANRAGDIDGVAAICVYAVDCQGDRARLAIVPNVDEYNFEALKQRIWDRRFDGVCKGQTANLGLHIVRSPRSFGNPSSDHAIWSFYNNRFIPKSGHWSGGAFSLEPWERCTMKNATFLVQDGVAHNAAN